jgi:hypothetical protein
VTAIVTPTIRVDPKAGRNESKIGRSVAIGPGHSARTPDGGRLRQEDPMSPRIAWVEEEAAEGRVAELYAQARTEAGWVPDIVKTFSGRPEALEAMIALSAVHFGPGGALMRAQREMIATYVSALLHCRY